MSQLRALLALLILLPLLPAPAGATAPTLTVVATGPEWGSALLLGAPDGGVDAVVGTANGTGELRHVTPQGWAHASAPVVRAPLARDAQGRLYALVHNATWRGVAALDPAGDLPVFPGFTPVGFTSQGLLAAGLCGNHGCLALVDEAHHASYFPENLTPFHAFGPDGLLYEASKSAILRVNIENGTAAFVADAPGLVQAFAFAQDGSAYVVARGNLSRLDLATGASETVLALPPLQSARAAFADGRLWLALSPANGGPAQIGYVDLGVAGFRGFEPAFQPGPVPDLVARASIGPESRSGGASWRTLRVSVTNEGPVEATAFAASVSWGGLVSGSRQAWLNGTSLAPGETASADFIVDTTLMAGNETATVRVLGALNDDQQGQAESDMANNVASVDFIAKVDTMREGLGF
jgi:hypothetical protein